MAWQDTGRVERPAGEAHPGWAWGIALVPAAAGLAAGGLFFLRSFEGAMPTVVGIAMLAWATSLAMPFVIIAWYAVQGAWKRPRERAGARFRAPSSDLRRIGVRLRWSARSLFFSPAGYDGRALPMLTLGMVVHVLAIVVLVIAGLAAALSGLASR